MTPVETARSNKKYLHVAAALRDGILAGRHAVGRPLPTIKKLAEEFDVSSMTALRAVGVLSDEGLVSTASRRSGSVVVRNTPAVHRSTTIACLLRPPEVRNAMDNFGMDMVRGLREEISRRDYRMIYHGLDEQDYERRMLELADADICGMILDQKTPQATVERLLRIGRPVVMFNRHIPLPGLSTVTPDYEAVGRSTVDFFLDRGYERVGFYKMPINEGNWPDTAAGDFYVLTSMRQGLLGRAKERGLGDDRVVLIPEPPVREVPPRPETFGLPRRKGPHWRPLGILADHDGLAVDIISAITQTDLELGRDIGVVGCYDLEAGQHSPRPPSTWWINREAIGATAVRELLSRVESPTAPVSCVRLTMAFMDRGTA